MHAPDTAILVLRLVLGLTMVAHGYNHLFGPGGLAGTARWFAGIGLRPPKLHALASGVVEIGAGVLLACGLLTALAAGGIIGTMTVAGVVAHRKNGFFVFKDGYEYVLVLSTAVLVPAITGPGSASLDDAFGIVLDSGAGAGLALGAGIGGAALLLVSSWRPPAATTGTPESAAPVDATAAD